MFIINSFENLSLTNNAFKIGWYLEKSGLTPYFLSLSTSGKLKSKFLKRFGYRVFTSDRSFSANVAALRKLIKTHTFDFVSTQTLRADYTVFITKILSGKLPHIFHVANRRNYLFPSCEPNFFLKNFLYPISCHLVDVNICCAQHLADKLVSRLKVPAPKVKVIQNGVRPPKAANRLARRNRVNIAFTGQLVRRKNLLFLLKALQLVKADYHCRLIGDGPEKKNLDRYINCHRLQNRIEIIPNQLDVRPFLRQTDIFVLPSLAEGMSLSLLEAMSYGSAYMASDIDANREVIGDDQDGILFSLKQGPADLAEKLKILIIDNKLRYRLGRAARQKVVNNFTEATMLTAFADFYRHRIFGPRI